MMYDIRQSRATRNPSDWRGTPGISAARTDERDLVADSIGPWISEGTDVFYKLRIHYVNCEMASVVFPDINDRIKANMLEMIYVINLAEILILWRQSCRAGVWTFVHIWTN